MVSGMWDRRPNRSGRDTNLGLHTSLFCLGDVVYLIQALVQVWDRWLCESLPASTEELDMLTVDFESHITSRL
jgi:hypothetical protein